MRGRDSTARHLVTLIRLLEGRRYMPTRAELARQLGLSKRSITRYVNALEEAHWPLPKSWHDQQEAA